MSRISFLALFALAVSTFAQAPALHRGSTIYIEPMGGYETYLAAAITKKQVPLVVVADKDKADYVIRSTVSQHTPTGPAVVVNNTNTASIGDNNSFGRGAGGGFPSAGNGSGHTSASIAVIDRHSSQVVFSYSVDKNRGHQLQSDAEACAKHLKEFIEKAEKPKK